jgi:hypothetical protein
LRYSNGTRCRNDNTTVRLEARLYHSALAERSAIEREFLLILLNGVTLLMPNLLRISLLIVMLLFVSGFAECYKPVTKNQLPARIKTVAVPAFQIESNALRYKIESRFTDAVMKELVHRGRGLRVQGEREGADAVIEGVIKSFNFAGVLLDDKGRARIFEVTIGAAVTVRDQTENKVLYDNQNFVFRGEYEFASDPRSFFNEEDPAILRMSRAFAESIVSTLINAVELEKK